MTYTVFNNREGFDPPRDLRGLSVSDAAQELLTEGDGFTHEIRRDGATGGWTLRISRHNGDTPHRYPAIFRSSARCRGHGV